MKNMPLIRFVKDSIRFPGTPRSPNLDVKWRSYSHLKLIKVNCLIKENREHDLKLGLCFHAILKMETTSNGKIQRMKVVDFELGENLDQFQLILICRTWDMFKLVHVIPIWRHFNACETFWLWVIICRIFTTEWCLI